jgi:hypothetical protein
VVHYTTWGPVATADPVTAEGDARAFILAKSRVAAPPCAFRLLRGWHSLEDDAWRWTERVFSMELDIPAPAEDAALRFGATLRFLFQLPEVVFANSSAVTLSVRINGTPLAPGMYSMPGKHEYVGAMPALGAGVATVEFELDRAIAPTHLDRRELGLQVDFSVAAPLGLF